MKFSLLAICLLSVTQSKDISIIKYGEELDPDKQIAEGNLKIEDEITKVKTDLSEVETELLDTSVFAGADINQVQHPEVDSEEDLIVDVDDVKDQQRITIKANETDTDIEIDIDREDRESVDVQFDVDHDGESHRVTLDDEGNMIKEEYRIDDQELNVYVDEYTGDDFEYETNNDEIEVEVYVDIDDQDLDLTDYIDFDIGLWGEKDDSADDDIFISGRYESKKRKRGDEEEIQLSPQDATEFPPLPGALMVNPLCSAEVPFLDMPEHVVIKQGRKFQVSCNVPESVTVLEYEWVKVNKETEEKETMTRDSELTINNVNCARGHAAMYQCKATYLCDDEEGNTITSTAESGEVTLMVDRGFVSNPLCQIFGDPHVITFDQKIYSFQGECTYLLAMDASEGSWFIYGRFVKCGSDGTCLDSVTVYVDGYAIELLRGWVINQNGKKMPIKEGKRLYPDDAMTIYYDGYEVFMELHTPQIQIIWDGLMSVKIEIASRQKTLGLCGNNNDNPDDDFMTYWGQVLDDKEEFGHRQAVDRKGICKKPPTQTSFIGDSTEARDHCEKVLLNGLFTFTSEYFENQATQRGSAHTLYRSDKLMEMCVFDFMSQMGIDTLSPQCYAGYNYVSMCKRLGICIPEGWQNSTGCLRKRELQDITVSQGCPWDTNALPFIRD